MPAIYYSVEVQRDAGEPEVRVVDKDGNVHRVETIRCEWGGAPDPREEGGAYFACTLRGPRLSRTTGKPKAGYDRPDQYALATVAEGEDPREVAAALSEWYSLRMLARMGKGYSA